MSEQPKSDLVTDSFVLTKEGEVLIKEVSLAEALKKLEEKQ